MDFSRYVGLPWLEGGRDVAVGVDCWGLFVHVFGDLTGVWLDSLENIRTRDEEIILGLIDDHSSSWVGVPLGQEQPLDAVLVHRRREWHIGLVVRRGLMLHIRENQTSVIQTIPSLCTEIMRYRGDA